MRLALISPTSLLDDFGSQSEGVHLALCHVALANPKYAAWFAARAKVGDCVILDNGTYEGTLCSVPEILEAAKRVSATTVVAPDFPAKHWRETFNAYLEFRERLPEPYKVFGCPQSGIGDIDGWFTCFENMVAHRERLSHVGISILAIPNAFGRITGTDDVELNRLVATAYIKDRFQGATWLNTEVRLHYLGLGHRIDLIQHYDIADSLDTASPVRHGIVGRKYVDGWLPRGKSPGHLDFDDRQLDDKDHIYRLYVQHNINVLKGFARQAEVKR